MAQPERNEQQRLRPAPLLFEPSAAVADPEHFFDLESMEDPGNCWPAPPSSPWRSVPRRTARSSSRPSRPPSSPIRAGSTG